MPVITKKKHQASFEDLILPCMLIAKFFLTFALHHFKNFFISGEQAQTMSFTMHWK